MKKTIVLLMAFAASFTLVSAQTNKVAIKDTVAQQTKYVCAMHKDITSNKPGKCSKCGMDLKKVDAAAKAYSCPMHKDVTSDKPGKCPKCGMDLTKTKAKKG